MSISSRPLAASIILGFALAGNPCLAAGSSNCESDRASQAPAAPTQIYLSRDLAPLFQAPLTEFLRQKPGLAAEVVVRAGSEMRKELASKPSTGILIVSGTKELVPLDRAGRLSPGSAIPLADIPLGVFVRSGASAGDLTDLKLLAGAGFGRIGVAAKGSGSVCGETEQALHRAGIWEAVLPRLKELPPEELISAAARGEVDAVIAGTHQADASVRPILILPARLHDPLDLTAVFLKDTPRTGGGPAIEEFLRSTKIRDTLIKAGGRLRTSAPPAKDELFLYCGAGLREAAEELVSEFQKATGFRVRPTYTGSGCLLAQITISESGDLYMPGEAFYMDMARRRGFITESAVVTYFIPVIMVGKGNPHGIRGLADLYRPGLRVGVGEKESTAVGEFTPKLLEAWKLSYDGLKKNIVATFATAPEMGVAVKLGAVDAAIQWDAVASWYRDGADVVAFPTDSSTISPVPLGVLKFSRNPGAARAFLQFAQSPVGRSIFQKHGHSIDPARPTFPPAR